MTENFLYILSSERHIHRLDLSTGFLITLNNNDAESSLVVFQNYIYYRTPALQLSRWDTSNQAPDKIFKFATCHGDKGLLMKYNQFQSLDSLLEECRKFLKDFDSEAIVIRVRVDDTKDVTDDYSESLNKKLKSYHHYEGREIPTLGDLRTKFYYLNQVDTRLDFGPYISWTNSWGP